MRSPGSFTVRVGSAYSNRGGEEYKVSDVYSKIWSYNNDIGMLKLSTSISLDGSTKKAIRMPRSSNYFPDENSNVYIQGWGTNPNDPETYQMYRADVSTMSTEECNEYWNDPPTNHSTQVCTLGNKDAGPCSVS